MAEKMTCAQCGMPCEAGEFHPYAACLMFTACHDSDTVRANIAQPAQAVDALQDAIFQIAAPLTRPAQTAGQQISSAAEDMAIEQVSDILRQYADEAEQYRWRTGEGLELTTASALADAIDIHLAQSAPQEVAVDAIREVIAQLQCTDETGLDAEPCYQLGEKLTHAIGNAQADGRNVPKGCITVPRSLVERWANVDAFNAPVGAAMELKVVAGQMLQHTAMLTAVPSAPEGESHE